MSAFDRLPLEVQEKIFNLAITTNGPGPFARHTVNAVPTPLQQLAIQHANLHAGTMVPDLRIAVFISRSFPLVLVNRSFLARNLARCARQFYHVFSSVLALRHCGGTPHGQALDLRHEVRRVVLDVSNAPMHGANFSMLPLLYEAARRLPNLEEIIVRIYDRVWTSPLPIPHWDPTSMFPKIKSFRIENPHHERRVYTLNRYHKRLQEVHAPARGELLHSTCVCNWPRRPDIQEATTTRMMLLLNTVLAADIAEHRALREAEAAARRSLGGVS